MKLGLNDPTPGAIQLRLATYLNFKQLPKPPTSFGHSALVHDWGALGNLTYGDCAIAGPCHQIMLWTAETGNQAPFTDQAALANYSAITGFNPNDPDSDQGTNIDDMARYWRRHGLVDANNKPHPIVAYLDLNPGDLRELWLATWLFQSVGMGFALPDSALQQAQDGEIWDVVPGANIVGGHYVPNVGRPAAGLGLGVTWGKTQPFTARFYQTYNNQGIVALSRDMFIKGKDVDGFDYQTLADDLKQVTRQ